MVQTLISQAKTASADFLGFKYQHHGSFVDITCLDTGDIERVYLGDSEMVHFQLGILMERHRVKVLTERLEKAKKAKQRKVVKDDVSVQSS